MLSLVVHTQKLFNVIHMSAASILFCDCRRYVIVLFIESRLPPLSMFCHHITGLELTFISGVYGTCVGNTRYFEPDNKSLIGVCGIFIGIGEVLGMWFGIHHKAVFTRHMVSGIRYIRPIALIYTVGRLPDTLCGIMWYTDAESRSVDVVIHTGRNKYSCGKEPSLT